MFFFNIWYDNHHPCYYYYYYQYHHHDKNGHKKNTGFWTTSSKIDWLNMWSSCENHSKWNEEEKKHLAWLHYYSLVFINWIVS